MAAQAVRDRGPAHNRFVRSNPEAIEYGIGVYDSEVPENSDVVVENVARFYFRVLIEKGQVTPERPLRQAAR